MVLEYLQIQNKACASFCFSASAPRIGYLSLWMHEGLSSPWFVTPRGISAIDTSDQIPHPQWVVIKFPPSRAGKDIKCPGYARGGMFKLRFDRYINPYFSCILVVFRNSTQQTVSYVENKCFVVFAGSSWQRRNLGNWAIMSTLVLTRDSNSSLADTPRTDHPGRW